MFVVLAGLSGCTSVQGSGIFDGIAKELSPHEAEDAHVVNLPEQLPGDWDLALFVCRPATVADVNAALGFNWSGVPDVTDSAFDYMIVLASETEVADHYVEWDSGSYLEPCSSMDGSIDWPGVSEFPRGDGTVGFEFDTHQRRWFRAP